YELGYASGATKMAESLYEHRITSISPQRIRVIHHQLNDQRHQLAQQAGAIAQLLAIDRTVPGGAAMDKLVTQGVQAVEQHTEKRRGIAAGQCQLCGFLAAGEALLPGGLVDLAALVIPEALEHVGVVQQHADAAGELLPDQRVDALFLIQRTKLLQEGLEGFLFRQPSPLVDLGGVGGVESDPEEDETAIEVIGLFGPVKPTQGTVDAQAQIGMLASALLPMALLQNLKLHIALLE